MSGARVGEWGSFDSSHSQELSGVWRLSSVPRGGAEGGGDWVRPSGPAGSRCERLDQSDSSLGQDLRPETTEPAHRKGPHRWVQGSELIFILAGGCFFPRGSCSFAEASAVNV